MRLLLGVVLGIVLTVLFAYVHDVAVTPPPETTAQVETGTVGAAPPPSGQTQPVPNPHTARGPNTLVNWKVAHERWDEFTTDMASLGRQAKRGLVRLAGGHF
jgi:hypothetical protein